MEITVCKVKKKCIHEVMAKLALQKKAVNLKTIDTIQHETWRADIRKKMKRISATSITTSGSLMCTHNTCQDKPYSGPQNRSQRI